MAGSKRQKKPGVWELRIDLGTDPTTGQRLRISRTFHGGERAAARRLAELVAATDQLHQDRLRKTSAAMTVAELTDHWVTVRQGDWSPTTLADHRRTIDNYITPGLGRQRVNSLSKAEIAAFYARLRTHGGHNRGQLSAQTVKKVHSVLHAALEEAIEIDLITINPATKARRPKVDRYIADVPSIAQIVTATQMADPLMAVLIRVAIATGARRGELVALQWDDIDLTPGIETIHVRRSVVQLARQPLATKSTKTDADAVIGIGPGTADVLRLWSHQVTDQLTQLRHPASIWVFPNYDTPSQPISPSTVTYRWTRIADKAGIPNVRLHDLRHATATHMLTGGVDVRTIAGRLRHSSPAMTLDVYAARDIDADRQAGLLIDQMLEQR